MRYPAAFLFDLDGVIIDSEKEYSKIWHRINEEFPTGVENLETVIKGCTLTSILTTYFPRNQRDNVSQMLHQLENRMKYYYAPGADAFLEAARERGIPVALVTSSDNVKMAHLREQMPELFGRFDVIITANDISHSKPDPEGYLLGANRLGVNPAECIVFEDSLQGIAAGHAAGAKVVGIAATLGSEKVATVADICIPDLSHLDINQLI